MTTNGNTNMLASIETPTYALEIRLLPAAHSVWFKKNKKTKRIVLSGDQANALERMITEDFHLALEEIERKFENFLVDNQLKPETI